MSKIYTIQKGLVIFLIVLFMVLILTVVCTVLGIMNLPKIEGILLLLFDIIYIIVLVIFIKLHYLNYIKISSKGVFHKDKFYSWDEVFLTVDYTIPNITRNAYNYRIYFNNSYYNTHEEIRNADREGFCIDLSIERLLLINQYYSKKINVIRESPMQNNILEKVMEHNNNIAA